MGVKPLRQSRPACQRTATRARAELPAEARSSAINGDEV